MKILPRYLALLALMALAPLHAEDNPVRTWKSAAGTSMEASLVATDGKTVTLKTTDGRTIKVAIGQLSAPDREYLAGGKSPSSPTQADPTAVDAAAKGNLLPVQRDDAGSNHALYESRYFRALVSAHGALTIQLNPKTSEPRHFALIRPVLNDPNVAGGKEELKAISYSQFAPASRQSSQVRFTAEYRDGLKIDYIYAFTENSFSTWFRVADLGAWKKESLSIHIAHWVGNMMKYAPDPKLIEPDSIEKHKFMITRWDKKHEEKERLTQKFSDAKSITGEIEEITMSGPVFGGEKIKFTAPASDQMAMSAWNYQSTAVHNGFSVYLTRKPDGADLSSNNFDKEKLTVSFE